MCGMQIGLSKKIRQINEVVSIPGLVKKIIFKLHFKNGLG